MRSVKFHFFYFFEVKVLEIPFREKKELKLRNHKIEIESASKDFTLIFLISLEKKASVWLSFDFRITVDL